MPEDPLVGVALKLARSVLPPPLKVVRGAPLLYAITVNNALEVTVNPKKPVRGQAAFQTDLCVFEARHDGIEIPRVVVEFKGAITTHDILTYSAKARKHKQIYPYLRYGVLMADDKTIPGKFFVHNEAMDFALAAGALDTESFTSAFSKMLKREVEVSRKLEEIAFSKPDAVAFFTELSLERKADR